MRQLFTRRQSMAAGAALAVGGLGLLTVAVAAHAAGAGSVQIANFAFGPQAMTVPAGTTVTWANADDDAHSVVADDGGFKSKAMDTGDRFTFTFAKPGEYAYHCGLHPRMIGKVIVR